MRLLVQVDPPPFTLIPEHIIILENVAQECGGIGVDQAAHHFYLVPLPTLGGVASLTRSRKERQIFLVEISALQVA